MSITLTFQAILDALSMAGIDEDDFRDDYSGRGMYGKTCFGIVGTASDFALFCAAVGWCAREALMNDWDWVGNVRSDSMGRSTIWYWPGVQVEGASE